MSYYNLKCCWAMLCVTASLAFANDALAQKDAFVGIELAVLPIEQVDIPARQTGVLKSIMVREGDAVQTDQLLGRLDARHASSDQKLAELNYLIAKKRLDYYSDDKLAETELLQQQEVSRQQDLLAEIAREKAQNQIRVSAAKKAQEVAKNELTRAERARKEFIDAVSKSQIESLTLAHQRSKLEAEQAEFERRIDALLSSSEQVKSRVEKLGIDKLQISKAEKHNDRQLLEAQVTASELKLALADQTLKDHEFMSPISGVVAQRYCQVGEWVRAGDPIVRVVGLDRLRGQGFVPAVLVAKLRQQKTFELRVVQNAQAESYTGTVSFISPEADPGTSEVMFWVEFDNSKRTVFPGMRMSIVESQ